MAAVPTTTPVTLTATVLRRCPLISPAVVSARPLARAAFTKVASRGSVSCQVAVTTEVSSSPSADEEGSDPESKVGARVRVTVPLKVYHVGKAPELDLNGMEGVIKQSCKKFCRRPYLISGRILVKTEYLIY
ncbi:hypothetical protein J5N97_021816 [Dioscorea zingiberensis]|uniref:Ferredoxin thioredoxin reductase alpha chain domain-containing protein n=1 Tax=Dioscorea zingiberensis TaxID=325984 RepID=A0A9D5C9L3_9LILI|nr:hypothetical protein J5N97_021816 [Dioscorea zingiberensis]